ncbi:MAG: hypothetical protein ABI700_20910 [Chloroflexota bacterium]
MNNRVESKKPRTSTESGVFPKPDLSMFAPQESKEAKPASKADDPGSTNTNLPAIREGQDSAKDHDDSAVGSKR